MHLTEGEFRAYLDSELDEAMLQRARDHLNACNSCQEQVAVMAARKQRVAAHLAALDSPALETAPPVQVARARLETQFSDQEKTTMWQQIFARKYRPAWSTLAVVLVLVAVLAFPPVRAIATDFLGLFRVQRIAVVELNPANLPEQLGSSSLLEQLISEDVNVETVGEPQQVASAAEAAALANLSVRQPTALDEEREIWVQPSTQITFDVDLPRVRLLLEEIGRGDVELPDELDGATVTAALPSAVTIGYGTGCDLSPGAEDSAPERQDDCIVLVQMPSPTVSAPPGLNIDQIGEAFLQVFGMTPEEAASFSQTVDWSTTLVIPVPHYNADYEDVSVDGVTGTLIQQEISDHPSQFMLLWVRDEIVYAITGPGQGEDILAIANSLE